MLMQPNWHHLQSDLTLSLASSGILPENTIPFHVAFACVFFHSLISSSPHTPIYTLLHPGEDLLLLYNSVPVDSLSPKSLLLEGRNHALFFAWWALNVVFSSNVSRVPLRDADTWVKEIQPCPLVSYGLVGRTDKLDKLEGHSTTVC